VFLEGHHPELTNPVKRGKKNSVVMNFYSPTLSLSVAVNAIASSTVHEKQVQGFDRGIQISRTNMKARGCFMFIYYKHILFQDVWILQSNLKHKFLYCLSNSLYLLSPKSKHVKVFQEWQMSGVVQVTVINSGGILKVRLTCIKLKLLQHISKPRC